MSIWKIYGRHAAARAYRRSPAPRGAKRSARKIRHAGRIGRSGVVPVLIGGVLHHRRGFSLRRRQLTHAFWHRRLKYLDPLAMPLESGYRVQSEHGGDLVGGDIGLVAVELLEKGYPSRIAHQADRVRGRGKDSKCVDVAAPQAFERRAGEVRDLVYEKTAKRVTELRPPHAAGKREGRGNGRARGKASGKIPGRV